jgi:hypothetical protein
MRVYIPVSAGDLIDRITILQIKKAEIPDKAQLANVSAELESLIAIRNCFPKLATPAVRAREKQLRKENRTLWDSENVVRALAAKKDFGRTFIASARRIYSTNDKRAALKRQINTLAGSTLREEKWFSGS